MLLYTNMDLAIDNLINDVNVDFSLWNFDGDGEWIGDFYSLPVDLSFEDMMFKVSDYEDCDITDFKLVEEQDEFRKYWSKIGDITYGMLLKLVEEVKEVCDCYNLKLVKYYVDDEYTMMYRAYLVFEYDGDTKRFEVLTGNGVNYIVDNLMELTDKGNNNIGFSINDYCDENIYLIVDMLNNLYDYGKEYEDKYWDIYADNKKMNIRINTLENLLNKYIRK